MMVFITVQLTSNVKLCALGFCVSTPVLVALTVSCTMFLSLVLKRIFFCVDVPRHFGVFLIGDYTISKLSTFVRRVHTSQIRMPQVIPGTSTI